MIRAASASAVALLLLVACSDGRLTPVAASCVPETLGEPPVYVDPDAALLAARDAAERFRLMAVGREQRMGRLAAVEGVLRACRVEEVPDGR